MSFRHILFSPTRRGTSAAADAAQALADLQLATGPEAADRLDDATSLPSGFDDLGAQAVAATFGPEFAAAMLDLETGRWAGPVSSTYGLHLVWLSERSAGSRRPFAEVRQQVSNDWVYQQRTAANEAVYRKLLERYEVVVEPPAASSAVTGGGS